MLQKLYSSLAKAEAYRVLQTFNRDAMQKDNKESSWITVNLEEQGVCGHAQEKTEQYMEQV